jgi:MoxR-like ATPase
MSNPQRPKIPVDGLKDSTGHPYYPDPQLIAAVNAAIVLGRPLLLTGEPGCGKSEFAWAVAGALGVELLRGHVRSDSRARDLLYRYDALHRFGDAHHSQDRLKDRSADPRRYIELLALGEGLIAPQRQVVLLDEIDKAPRDLPNDLLRELERQEFEIPELGDTELAELSDRDAAVTTRWGQPLQRIMRRPVGAPAPVVIITSNVERQLPDPFLRRCVFFHIGFPDAARLRAILRSRAEGLPYLDHAIDLFLTLRQERRLTKKPATSELIDWVTVLQSLDQSEVLASLRGLANGIDRSADRLRLGAGAWRQLPALYCLIKLREDLQAVGC